MAWLCGAALLLASVAANLRVLDFGFLYLRDDDINVALNPHMGGLGAARIHWMFSDWSYARRYMPLGWLGFAATYEVAGLDPAPYHAVALGLYAVNVALVYALVLQVLRLFAPARGTTGLGAWDAAAAALAAGWWAMSPLRVETTAWVSGNLYGQATALLLASFLAYLRSYGHAGGRRAAWIALAVFGYAASLLTYPLALGFPVLLVGLDWLWSRSRPGVFPALLVEKALFAVPLAAMLTATLMTRFVNTDVFGAVPSLQDFPVVSRVAQSAYIAAYFLWKPWWPVHLSPLYDTLFDFRAAEPRFLLSVAAVGAASLYALLAFRRRPAVAVAWFGYLALAAPFFGLTERPHMPSDRYGYFLTVVPAVVLAAALARAEKPASRRLAALGALAVVAVLARLTWRQLDIWTSDRVQHAYVAAHLTHPVLLEDFTSRLLILEFIRGHEKAAADAVNAYLKANPSSPSYRHAATIIADKARLEGYYGPVSSLAILQDQLALRFARAGEFREANDHFEDALRQDDRFYQASYDRALVLLRLGRSEDALRSFNWSARWAPSGLPPAQRREFLERLRKSAAEEGQTRLAAAAGAALAR
jgi:tetratricopeptide (TPR) repeat protein